MARSKSGENDRLAELLKDLRKQGVVSTRYREITIRGMAYLDSIRFSQEKARKPLTRGNL